MPGNAAVEAAITRFGFYPLAPRAPRPTPDALRQQAAQAGVTLPEAFITFSAEHGAGAFEQRVSIDLPAGCPLGPVFIVDILYAVGAPDDWDALALRDDTYDGRLPLAALPIATDAGGSLLLQAPEDGTIYARDHEHLDLDSTAASARQPTWPPTAWRWMSTTRPVGADVGRTPPRAGGQPDRAWQPVPGGGIV
jgi:hypothetical protein